MGIYDIEDRDKHMERHVAMADPGPEKMRQWLVELRAAVNRDIDAVLESEDPEAIRTWTILFGMKTPKGVIGLGGGSGREHAELILKYLFEMVRTD